jgi:hypothetical protein
MYINWHFFILHNRKEHYKFHVKKGLKAPVYGQFFPSHFFPGNFIPDVSSPTHFFPGHIFLGYLYSRHFFSWHFFLRHLFSGQFFPWSYSRAYHPYFLQLSYEKRHIQTKGLLINNKITTCVKSKNCVNMVKN